MLSCYQKMYAIICGAASDAIDVLTDTADTTQAISILQKALWMAEELYIEGTEKRE